MPNDWDDSDDEYSSELDVLHGYKPAHGAYRDDYEPDLAALTEFAVDGSADRLDVAGSTDVEEAYEPAVLFTVSNASQAVSVTTVLNGMVHRIELSPRVASSLTEVELADEIISVAQVAAAKAQSGQYEFIYELMRIQGQDRDSIRQVLETTMGLPTPEEAIAKESRLITRHLHGHDN